MKKIKITFRVTPEEYENILQAVDVYYPNTSGKTSEYVRQKVLHSDVPIGIDKEIRELKYQIRKVGTNINQIAKKINAGFGYAVDATYAIEEVQKIEQSFERLLEIVEDKKSGDYKIDAHERGKGES